MISSWKANPIYISLQWRMRNKEYQTMRGCASFNLTAQTSAFTQGTGKLCSNEKENAWKY